ncbi:hypothetical protein ACFLYY_02075 [Patescibacteria group bacterium]
MHKNSLKRGVIALLLLGFTLPVFSVAQDIPVQIPEDFEEAKEFGGKVLETSEKELPGAIERIWNEEVIPLWKKMYGWAKENIWDSRISPWLKRTWETTKNIFRGEVERRKPQVEEDFQQEKNELKEEAPVVGKSLWERFKEIIK